jgi:peroxiredoxin
MPAVETTSIPLGFAAPDFTLPDTVSGKEISLKDLKGEKGTLIMFICNHCPYVVHIKEQLVSLANDYQSKGISFIAISSNDVVKYPADSPENMKIFAEQNKFPFPYLYDESQDVAKAYDAACTPDFSIFDTDMKCVYRGQLDGSRPSNGKPVTGEDIRNFLDSLIAGKISGVSQIPSIGCSIKWKTDVR